jgi:hypothetical protein
MFMRVPCFIGMSGKNQTWTKATVALKVYPDFSVACRAAATALAEMIRAAF